MKTVTKIVKKNALYQHYFNFCAAYFPTQVAAVLNSICCYKETNVVLARYCLKPNLSSKLLSAKAYFEEGHFNLVEEVLTLSDPEFVTDNMSAAHLYGLMQLLKDDEKKALNYLQIAASNTDSGWCPHQNMAARYPSKYEANQVDLLAGDNALLFDAYNYIAQRLTHIGFGYLGVNFYTKALNRQQLLCKKPLEFSQELVFWLHQHEIKELRIISWEWLTQIGHLGMLDVLFRMRTLSWWQGQAVILCPLESMIANKVMLHLFEKEAIIAKVGFNISNTLAAELFSLQRCAGLGFNVWADSDEVMPWQQAGARLMRQWDQEQLTLPLKNAFDHKYERNISLLDNVNAVKKKWGMKSDDWFVCIHLRDAGFYGEMANVGQVHRNTDIDAYINTVRYITQQGGWVIRLGSDPSLAFPRMEKVIDYAGSAVRTELLDLYFIRNARFFIGTTSGLTNVAISFGIPCALVNCITVDSQLWHNRVRFALKRIQVNNSDYLTQRQLTSTPWRWRQFAMEVLRRHNAIVINNTSDEILETVREIECIANENIDEYVKNYPSAKSLIQKWASSLSIPEYYGSATPSLYYLSKYQHSFLHDTSHGVDNYQKNLISGPDNVI